MHWLIIISIWCTLGMYGCQPWHRTAPSSKAQPPTNKPVKQDQPPSASSSPSSEPINQSQTYSRRPIPQPRKQGPATDSIRGAGEKILSTHSYELFWRASDSEICSWTGQVAEVVQVFSSGPELSIKDDIDYEERFEREILPALRTQCPSLRSVKVNHYIKGVRLNEWLKEHREDEPISGEERPLSTITVEMDAKGTQWYYRMNGYSSLSDLRRKREVLYPNSAKNEAILNKWKQRAEESDAKQRAEEEAAEKKLANTTATADDQLSLSEIDNEHKKLFLMIYDGEFVALSERKDIQDLPIILYRNAMSRYDELCHQFFNDRVKVEETVQSLHQEWDPITRRMRNVNKTVTVTSHVERRYEQVYRSTFNKGFGAALKHSQKDVQERTTRRPNLWDDIAAKGAVMMEGAIKERERLDKANASLKLLLSPEACGKPGIVRFMDNINRYIAHDYPDDAYAKPINGTFPYKEKMHPDNAYIERFYVNVPPTFSPDFPVPVDGEKITVYLNKNSERQGLKWVQISLLSLRDLNQDRTYTKIKLPADVQQAMEEKKYSVVQCTYHDGRSSLSLYYWNGNGPLPSESVQDYAKNTISKAQTSCPISAQ